MNVITSTGWTDQRITLLTTLWERGLTADQIAGELGGVTRNAVVGKVHRLGLSGRVFFPAAPRQPRPPAARPAPRPPVPVKAAPVKTAPVPVVPLLAVPDPVPSAEPMGDRCTILELTAFTCRWPIGDPGKPGFAYCGSGTKEALPYCAWHARIAYQPAEVRDRRRAGGRS